MATYRASQQIDTSYIANGDEAYVARILFLDSSNRLTVNLASTDDASDFGAGTDPQLTDDAEANLGIAFRVTGGSGDGNVYKYPLSDLTMTDDTEPYDWDNVENEATWDAIISAIAGATMVQCLLVNRNHNNIDWDKLITVEGGVTAVPLPVPDGAEMLPALPASIDGAARWPGGLMAEVESYRASMFGGPAAATLNVTGPEAGLRWLLTQLRRPVHVRGRQAGMVWWGYAHRIELRLGAILITVSLDGYRTAIAVQYLRDGRDLGLRSGFHVEQPAASQYGQIELLGAQEVMEPTAEQLAALLDPYLKIARGVEVSRQPATGARVYCRGWSAALEWRHAPRYHENASYGDITNFADSRGQYTGPHSFPTTRDSEWAAWVDFEDRHPGYDVYLSSARMHISGPDEDADSNSSYSDEWHASIWQRAHTSAGNPTTTDPPSARLGDEIEFSAASLPRVPSPIPSPPPYPYRHHATSWSLTFRSRTYCCRKQAFSWSCAAR